ncbi:MAG: dihydrolipoamide acetyltransferase [Gammaproteobacteria bacterium BRH_c0]|nr:MAG: dihydrolipoamide acetyltransferase [Gammaproteobacteria bacterium BRH_c0]
MASETIKVPDLGGADEVEVIEVSVSIGDEISVEDTLLVLESDKASMDVPSPKAGVVKKVLVKVGDKISQGTAIVEMESSDSAAPEKAESSAAEKKPEAEPEAEKPPAKESEGKKSDKPAAKSQSAEQTVKLPDLGTGDAVDIIEINVAVGDEVAEGDTLMTLEGDKATMDVPSPYAGKITALLVKEGGKVKSGDAVAEMTTQSAVESAPEQQPEQQPEPESKPPQPAPASEKPAEKPPQTAEPSTAPGTLNEAEAPAADVYAGPMVRQFARELGVDLRNVKGSGDKGRIAREDVQAYVKKALSALESGAPGTATGGAGIPQIPDLDYSQFGEIEELPLSRIAKLTAANMTRTWLNVPAVTQFDDADITEMEEFRKGLKAEADKRGVKLTPVAFMMLACARAMTAHPVINRSWHSSGEKLIQKKFVHIGMAVDTPRGLMVPVIRDVDKKGLWELAEETAAVAQKARDGKLSANDMQGGGFSISSLGAIGGRGFTPIVNAPEAAILGISKASIQPVWDGKAFVPRQLLPLSLTYDHRLINGADAGKFMTDLVSMMGDIRRLLL